jgi:predicted nucleic acid-binding protein
MKIYLDVCCLNRPFDDHQQDRVRLESEAVLTILTRCQAKTYTLLNSEVIDVGISKIPDNDRQEKVRLLSSISQNYLVVNEKIERRASEIQELSFRPYDALHIACAEMARADAFLTTDDRLLHKAANRKHFLKVRLENPVKWLMEDIGR